MNNERIKYLAWDSDFFGEKTGRIYANDNNCLKEVLLKAQNDDYKLIYAFADKDFHIDKNILRQFNGHLADRKILYEKSIVNTKENMLFVSEYENNELLPELEQLAYGSGTYSRFKQDKNFQTDDFYRMYKIWIENSIKKQNADNVFIVKEGIDIKGMITLKTGQEKGGIGLLSVSPDSQGKGYGQALIIACENKLLNKGIFILDVPTQADNIQACKFYEKCGFQIKEIANIYHFWIGRK